MKFQEYIDNLSYRHQQVIYFCVFIAFLLATLETVVMALAALAVSAIALFPGLVFASIAALYLCDYFCGKSADASIKAARERRRGK